MPAIRDLGEDGEEAASSTLRDLRDVVSPEVPGESRIIEAARIKATHPMAYPDAFARQRPSLTMRHCGPVAAAVRFRVRPDLCAWSPCPDAATMWS